MPKKSKPPHSSTTLPSTTRNSHSHKHNTHRPKTLPHPPLQTPPLRPPQPKSNPSSLHHTPDNIQMIHLPSILLFLRISYNQVLSRFPPPTPHIIPPPPPPLFPF
ncbi:hypothetical protein L207DRAFT_516043 [Hyaloscypha variabilis F]|uniref:Uncharacterized protein n=1 Tax=Hyaloscypha variabilis (strain UAMH 11265 / GT02V1 / F) TaxID=1149755 RepID=A0A2J6RCX4_HYAVF|nr:hypothetical protein L207DRAFT_516043 [Hyaloscypha variabilis F]